MRNTEFVTAVEAVQQGEQFVSTELTRTMPIPAME
jgi:hypothetical protein